MYSTFLDNYRLFVSKFKNMICSILGLILCVYCIYLRNVNKIVKIAERFYVYICIVTEIKTFIMKLTRNRHAYINNCW